MCENCRSFFCHYCGNNLSLTGRDISLLSINLSSTCENCINCEKLNFSDDDEGYVFREEDYFTLPIPIKSPDEVGSADWTTDEETESATEEDSGSEWEDETQSEEEESEEEDETQSEEEESEDETQSEGEEEESEESEEEEATKDTKEFTDADILKYVLERIKKSREEIINDMLDE